MSETIDLDPVIWAGGSGNLASSNYITGGVIDPSTGSLSNLTYGPATGQILFASTLDGSSDLEVGAGGTLTGSLAAEDVFFENSSSAYVLAGDLSAGDVDIGPGTLTVDGSGSTLSAYSGIDIGYDPGTDVIAPGLMTVSNGATVSTASLAIDSGELAVDGSGSTLVTSRAIEIGFGLGTAAIGLMAISHGAMVSTGEVLGLSTGTITVDGGSLQVNGFVNYDGTLDASDGSDVSITGGMYLFVGSSISVDTASAIEIGGSTHFTAGFIVVDAGQTLAGAGMIDASVDVSGTLQASGGLVQVTGDVSGHGTVNVAADATLEIDGTLANGVSDKFLGAGTLIIESALLSDDILSVAGGGTLVLVGGANSTDTIDFAGTGELDIVGIPEETISNFELGDTIDIAGGIANAITYDAATGRFDLVQETQGQPNVVVGSLNLFGLGPDTLLIAQSDGDGGTEVTVACFAGGTNILTLRGERPVEALRVGDLAVTQAGAARPIVWVGHRRINCRRHPKPQDVWPVRVRAGAFGPGLPLRDLMLSPEHAVYVDSVLVPIRCLINGVTIAQEERDQVTYYHVELEQHDVILAEGMPCESWLDCGNRAMFANCPVTELHPSFGRDPAAAWAHDACAPLVSDGYCLEAIRQKIALRAGIATDAPLMDLRGFLDCVSNDRVEGWAQNPQYPEAAVCLDVVVDGRVVAQSLANRYRPDLAAAGLGSGRHAFFVRLPVTLTAEQQQTLVIRRSADQRPLARSAAQMAAA